MSDLRIADLPWYDRNPKSKPGRYDITLPPHASTGRLEYTCPTDKRALVELLQATVLRRTAADSVLTVLGYWIFTPKGKVNTMILKAELITNTVGDRVSSELGKNIMLHPGDNLTGVTSDTSTGGECGYFLSYKLTEFNAITKLHQIPSVEPAKPDLQAPTEEIEKPWWQWW